MPHQGPATALVAVLLVAGCSSNVEVQAPAVKGADERACDALENRAPDSVAGADARDVDTAGSAAAWGDPPIILRCGVPAPAVTDVALRCDTVNGVDWYTEEADAGYLFTTIGREPAVRIDVPYDYEPAGDALVDVAAAVRGSTTVQRPCS